MKANAPEKIWVNDLKHRKENSMTDKEKIKAIVKQYADKGEKMYSEAIDSRGSHYNAGFWDGYRDCANGLLRELEDIQEEPTTSVWHDASEKPKMNSIIVINNDQTTLSIEYVGQSLCGVERWAYLDNLLKL